MQKQRFKDEMDTLEIVERRLAVLICARLRDRSQIKHAISVQDRLRSKSMGWSGVEEIRKWRDTR
ncbi:hypothetical protein CW696_07935 [ANME-2 cluster archaeon]|nr:MAG: hypothetical protein CW696_07935 [ANME-2 cluster archaeon]